jgi:hypothetical protein
MLNKLESESLSFSGIFEINKLKNRRVRHGETDRKIFMQQSRKCCSLEGAPSVAGRKSSVVCRSVVPWKIQCVAIL